jgi:hypothetical protein
LYIEHYRASIDSFARTKLRREQTGGDGRRERGGPRGSHPGLHQGHCRQSQTFRLQDETNLHVPPQKAGPHSEKHWRLLEHPAQLSTILSIGSDGSMLPSAWTKSSTGIG